MYGLVEIQFPLSLLLLHKLSTLCLQIIRCMPSCITKQVKTTLPDGNRRGQYQALSFEPYMDDDVSPQVPMHPDFGTT
jgi:hypothetical protein